MKVVFAYLPLDFDGYFCVSQNRFAKVRGDKELIYPLVPAQALTILHNAGHKVLFIDAICDKLDFKQFAKRVAKFQPDILFFESKTPVIKQNWQTVGLLKKQFPKLLIAAVGDHVSVLPEETMKKSKVDFIVRGGDFDFGIFQLVNHLDKKSDLPRGIYYRKAGKIQNTGDYELVQDLDSLPPIDRELIPWREYHEAWRMYDDFMYILASRGCPYNCTFCSWPQMLYKSKIRFRSVPKVLDEMEMLIHRYKIKELFFDDDSFTCNKKWVMEFCKGIKDRKIEVLWSCNGRVDNTDEEMLKAMKSAGCRLIKYGIESASQSTLDRIKKRYSLSQVKKSFALSKKLGILRHGTAMIGYPWESKEDMLKTVAFVKSLDVDSVQFSIPIAYPGTALFEEAKSKGWLAAKPGDWEKFDMSAPTLLHPNMKPHEIVTLCAHAWRQVYFSPRYMLRKLYGIRSYKDLHWVAKGAKSVLKGHIHALNQKKSPEC